MVTRTSLCPLVFLCAILLPGIPARSDETDQFMLPDRDAFADLGSFVDRLHYRVLERIVDETNKRIARAHKIADEQHRREILQRLHSSRRLADRARYHFGQGWVATREVDTALSSPAARQAYPGRTTIHFTKDWIYADAHFLLDLRKTMTLFRGGTIKVHGVTLGIDKIGHAFDLGHLYFKTYHSHLDRGLDEDEAMRQTIRSYSTGLVSEAGIIGAVGTGVNSNADLAANYLGMKFYMNLTEPVMLEGEEHPPLLVRIGDFWALNTHVRPDSGFMAPFYSDHLNEALNPCIYDVTMRDNIVRRLRENKERILAVYADENDQPRPREYFEQLYAEHTTYFGEDYGHGGIDPRATIAKACFPDPDSQQENKSVNEARNKEAAAAPQRSGDPHPNGKRLVAED